MNKRQKITKAIKKNSTDTKQGILIEYSKIEEILDDIEAIDYVHSSPHVKEKYTKKFEDWYLNYVKLENKGLTDEDGIKITYKPYLFKKWNEDLDTLIV